MSYDLCEELIVEIFTRLPTKSLLRFRSVSKSLRACIGSRAFVRLHTLRSPPKVMIIHQVHFQGETCGTDMYTLHSGGQLSNDPYVGVTAVDYPFHSFLIVGSCNGIVCVYQFGNGIYLWNPSIRRKVSRPSLSDPKGQWGPLGFGFDPVVDDYKILMRAKCRTEEGFVRKTFVYTMKTDTWREIASPTMDQLSCVTSCHQCLFNGALQWVVRRCLTDSGDDCLYYILSFDLSSEVFSTIELPEPSWETKQVTIINGSLAVLSSNKHDDSWIWVRNNTTASWSVAFKLNTREFDEAHMVFQLTANNDLLFNSFYRGVIVYNPETKERSKLVGLSASSLVGVTSSCHGLLMTPCIESLGLLDMGTSCDQGKRKRKRSRAQI